MDHATTHNHSYPFRTHEEEREELALVPWRLEPRPHGREDRREGNVRAELALRDPRRARHVRGVGGRVNVEDVEWVRHGAVADVDVIAR